VCFPPLYLAKHLWPSTERFVSAKFRETANAVLFGNSELRQKRVWQYARAWKSGLTASGIWLPANRSGMFFDQTPFDHGGVAAPIPSRLLASALLPHR